MKGSSISTPAEPNANANGRPARTQLSYLIRFFALGISDHSGVDHLVTGPTCLSPVRHGTKHVLKLEGIQSSVVGQQVGDHALHLTAVRGEDCKLVDDSSITNFVQWDSRNLLPERLKYLLVMENHAVVDHVQPFSIAVEIGNVGRMFTGTTNDLHDDIEPLELCQSFSLASTLAFKLMLPLNDSDAGENGANRANRLNPGRRVEGLDGVLDLAPTGIHEQDVPRKKSRQCCEGHHPPDGCKNCLHTLSPLRDEQYAPRLGSRSRSYWRAANLLPAHFFGSFR